MLQQGVSEIGRFIARESGGRKTIRFETGTRCGPQYVRIEFVRLSQPRVAYLDSRGAPAMAIVREELERVLPASAGPRNWLVYVDGLVDSASGWAEVLDADAPGPTNPHNAGGLFAFVWGARHAPSRAQLPYYAYLILHELTHTLGGVQKNAPNTSGAWHCTDDFDLMRYEDGRTAHPQATPCRRATMFGGAYDCNQDDYFNPRRRPAPTLPPTGTCTTRPSSAVAASSERRAAKPLQASAYREPSVPARAGRPSSPTRPASRNRPTLKFGQAGPISL